MKLPWRNNEKLIRALYDKVSELEEQLKTYNTEKAVAATIKSMKKAITTDVLNQVASTELVEAIAKQVVSKIRASKTGVI